MFPAHAGMNGVFRGTFCKGEMFPAHAGMNADVSGVAQITAMFPAHAGMNRNRAKTGRAGPDVPRTRGNESACKTSGTRSA